MSLLNGERSVWMPLLFSTAVPDLVVSLAGDGWFGNGQLGVGQVLGGGGGFVDGQRALRAHCGCEHKVDCRHWISLIADVVRTEDKRPVSGCFQVFPCTQVHQLFLAQVRVDWCCFLTVQ